MAEETMTIEEARKRSDAARRAIARAGGLLTERELAHGLGVTHQALQSRRTHDKLRAPAGETTRSRVYTQADLVILTHERDERDAPTEPPISEQDRAANPNG